MSSARSKQYWVPALAALFLALGIAIGFFFARRTPSNEIKLSIEDNPMLYLSALLESYYVDSLASDSIYYYGVNGILSHLDPHTVYINAKELQTINQTLSGDFYGFGINYFTLQDTLYVCGIMPQSPAAKSGIRIGDQLIAINKIVLHDNEHSDSIMKQCVERQEPQPISFTIRSATGQIKTIQIRPEKIIHSSLSAAVMLDSVCGYIAIETFSETTATAFHEALKQLKQEGLQQLIIDVRGNPGGYMDAVAQIADELISGNDTLFYTLDKKGREAIMAGKPGLYETGPLSIIIDEESASASEILAGVVQDYDRGIIYGSRSFGKGLVQEQFDLPNGDAIRITTARYYLPSGRFIQRPYNTLSHADYFEQTINTPIDTLQFPASYTLRLHRRVRSGTGIEPDIPVKSYSRIEDFPENPFIRKAVYNLYYQNPNKVTPFRTLKHMKASATLPNTWKIALQQIPQHIPDSLSIWRTKQKSYIEHLALAEWANICFGINGQIAFSWPHDAALRTARYGFFENPLAR